MDYRNGYTDIYLANFEYVLPYLFISDTWFRSSYFVLLRSDQIAIQKSTIDSVCNSNVIQATIINIFNIVSLLLSNLAYSKYLDPGVFASNLLTMLSSIITLKLISYIHFNSNILHISELLQKDPQNPEVSQIDEFVKG